MEKTVFCDLKKFEYNNIKLSEVASWAVWDKKDINNLEIIEKDINKLNGKIIFVALNFGGKERPVGWTDWKNFHGNRDKRLPALLSGTRFEGAYMTDIIKNQYNPNAEDFMNKLNNDVINTSLDFFCQEIELLKTDNIEMYLFGKAVEKIFKENVKHHKVFSLLQQKLLKCQRIDHYSYSNPFFTKKASKQLGLPDVIFN